MKKTIFIFILITKQLFAAYCPYGCLDSSTQDIYIQIGEKNYDSNDNMMLQGFLDIADKMKSYYQDFENKSSKMIEDGAKIQYLENVISAEIILELDRSINLKSLEIESNSIKTKQNSQSTIK